MLTSLSNLLTVVMESAQRNFTKFGRVLPALFIFPPQGELMIFGLPMRNEQEMAAAPHVARGLVSEHKAQMYAYVAEAFVKDLSFPTNTTPAEIAAAALGVAGRVNQQPGHREAILVIGATTHGARLQGGFDILRDAAGRGTLARRPIRTAADTAGAWAQLYEPMPRPDEYAGLIERILRETKNTGERGGRLL